MTKQELEMIADVIDETAERRLAPIRARLDALEADSRQAAATFRRVMEKLETEEAAG